MPHAWINPITNWIMICQTHRSCMSRVWIIHFTSTNESCCSYELVMSHARVNTGTTSERNESEISEGSSLWPTNPPPITFSKWNLAHHIYTRTQIYIHIWIYACIHLYICIHIYIYIIGRYIYIVGTEAWERGDVRRDLVHHVYTRTRTHTNINLYMYISVYIYIYMYIYIYHRTLYINRKHRDLGRRGREEGGSAVMIREQKWIFVAGLIYMRATTHLYVWCMIHSACHVTHVN